MPQPEQYLSRLAGKAAVVTGAGSIDPAFAGTGAAIATVFAREGAGLCVVDRDLDRARTTCAALTAHGAEAIPLVVDVTSDRDCLAAIEACRDRFGRVDILVNNVGVVDGRTSAGDFDGADWDRVIATNLKSAVLMSRHAIPAMAAGGGGSIVNISSIAAMQGFGGGMAYAPSKAALIALTRELAVRHGRDGIRVNAIAPGHIHTPMVAGLDFGKRSLRRKAAPIGIEGDAWDVAAAALFLAGDEARFVTGTYLPVDGGVTAIGAIASHALIASPDE